MTTDAAAGVARGRRLRRTGLLALYATAGLMVLVLAGGLVASAVGWIADNDATLAVVGAALVVGGLVTTGVLNQRGATMVHTHFDAFVARPPEDVPAELRVGPRRPILLAWTALAAMVVGVVVIAVIASTGLSVFGALIAALNVVGVVWKGPSVLNVPAAYLDRSGIRLPLVGIHAPWKSVEGIRVRSNGRLVITLSGPVTATGEQPRRWTEQAVAEARSRMEVTMSVRRPELVVWVADRCAGLVN